MADSGAGILIPRPSTCDPEQWARFNDETSRLITREILAAVLTGLPRIVLLKPASTPND